MLHQDQRRQTWASVLALLWAAPCRQTPCRVYSYLAPAPGVTLSPLLTHLGIPLPQLLGVVRRGEGLGVKEGGQVSFCMYVCWLAPNHNP